jgi:selenocysteine lyase/cysteine desulfurase
VSGDLAFQGLEDPSDEQAWRQIRACYDLAPGFTHLEHGYVGMQARPVLEARARYEAEVASQTALYLRQRWPADAGAAIAGLADFAGAEGFEVALTRNVTEGMNIAIQGLPWEPGDEVIVSATDYHSVVQTVDMTAERRGLAVRRVRLPLDPASDDDVVSAYRAAFTERTRALVLTHVVHLTGQILPVAAIASMAHRHGAVVLLDAAHGFAHLPDRIDALGADAVAVNMHKWLGAPMGAGALFVRRDLLPRLSPLYGDREHGPNDIRRLARFGTMPPAPIRAIADAIAFHCAVGGEAKLARLRYLQRRWTQAARAMAHVELLVPSDPARAGALGSFRVPAVPAAVLAEMLWERWRILTVGRPVDDRDAVRVTPSLANGADDVDRLVDALAAIGRELPAA